MALSQKWPKLTVLLLFKRWETKSGHLTQTIEQWCPL